MATDGKKQNKQQQQQQQQQQNKLGGVPITKENLCPKFFCSVLKNTLNIFLGHYIVAW